MLVALARNLALILAEDHIALKVDFHGQFIFLDPRLASRSTFDFAFPAMRDYAQSRPHLLPC